MKNVVVGIVAVACSLAGLMAQGDIDGALVGGASLQAESFAQIVNYRV